MSDESIIEPKAVAFNIDADTTTVLFDDGSIVTESFIIGERRIKYKYLGYMAPDVPEQEETAEPEQQEKGEDIDSEKDNNNEDNEE